MDDLLFDSDVLIDVLKGHAPTVRALGHVPDAAGKYYSVVTAAELWAGVPEADGDAAAALTRLLGSMRAIDVDVAVARLAGRYRRRYGSEAGTSLPDALIAASARTRRAVLVTNNRRHFPMSDIVVWTPGDLPSLPPTAPNGGHEPP